MSKILGDGIKKINKEYKTLSIYTASIDEKLNELNLIFSTYIINSEINKINSLSMYCILSPV